MPEIAYVGGPLDGHVRELMDGEITAESYIPDGTLMVRYVEDGIDSNGRIIMRATERKPMQEFFPTKAAIAARSKAVFVSVHDLYGALVHAVDGEDQVVSSFQLGNENTNLKTIEDALARVPIVLAELAGLELSSEWSERGGHPFAQVRPLTDPFA